MQIILLESMHKRLSTYEQRTVTRMATILDPRFKKNGFRLNTNAEQASVALENELVNLSLIEIPTTLDLPTENTAQDPLFEFLNERPVNKHGNARSDGIVIKRHYLERAVVGQELDPLLWNQVSINNVIIRCSNICIYVY